MLHCETLSQKEKKQPTCVIIYTANIHYIRAEILAEQMSTLKSHFLSVITATIRTAAAALLNPVAPERLYVLGRCNRCL